jgi:hypothetical protein
MVQVINDPNRDKNAPYVRGISAALQGLITHKTNEMAQKRHRESTASGLQHLLNIPAQEAHNLASLDPKILEHVVKQKLEQPERESNFQILQQLLGNQENQNFDQQQLEQQQPQQQQQPEMQQQPGAEQSQQQMQSPQQGGQQQFQPQQPRGNPLAGIKGQLSGKQFHDLSNIFLKKQSNDIAGQEKRQIHIDKMNQSFNEKLGQAVDISNEIVDVADKLLEDIDTGKVNFNALGVAAERIPGGTLFTNDETASFITNSNVLLDLYSNFTKGVASNLKIKLKEKGKPNLALSADVNKKIIEHIKDSRNTILDLAKARNQLIMENGGEQPKNLEDLARHRMEKWKDAKGPNLDPSEYEEGTVLRNPKNGLLFTVQGGEWEPFKESILE